MAKPKVKRNRKKPKKHNPIALLAIGEGSQKGKVYWAAKRLADKDSQKSVVVIDLKKPEYIPPKTMLYVQQDALKFLSGVAPSTVEKIYDKYAFNFISLGRFGKDPETFRKTIAEQAVVRIQNLGADVKSVGKRVPDADLRMRHYAKSALRALVPGGKFVILVGKEAFTNRLLKAVRASGFEIRKVHKLSLEAIKRSGSSQALFDHHHGASVYRIHAVKSKRA